MTESTSAGGTGCDLLETTNVRSSSIDLNSTVNPGSNQFRLLNGKLWPGVDVRPFSPTCRSRLLMYGTYPNASQFHWQFTPSETEIHPEIQQWAPKQMQTTTEKRYGREEGMQIQTKFKKMHHSKQIENENSWKRNQKLAHSWSIYLNPYLKSIGRQG